MKRPFWRSQSGTWCVWLDNGKLKTLGKDEHGATRKHPPKEIEEAWHALGKDEPKPKDMTMAEVAEKYLAYLTHPKTKRNAKDHLDWFMAYTGKGVKVSTLRLYHLNEYLGTKDWSEGMKATAVNRICSALNHAVNEGYLEGHKVKFARGKRPRFTRRQTIPTDAQQDKLEEAAYPELRTILTALRLSGCRPNELCAVTIDKVDLNERAMKVPNKTEKTTGKAERDVYLSNPLVELIRSAIGSRKEGPVFLNTKENQWTPERIHNQVRRIRVRLGLPDDLVPYSRRHGFLSRAVNDTYFPHVPG